MIKTSAKKYSKKELDGIDPDIYARRWFILGTLCFALLGVMLANSSMSIGLPQMAVDLGLDQLTMTWIVNIYSLLFASLLFIAGAVGDRYGRKLALQAGSAIFAASALYAAAFAHTGTELVIARAFMGVGGALVMPTTLSIVNNAFPKKQRARAIAIWSAVSGVGMMLGSIVSGILLEYFSWHSLFYLSVVVAGGGLVLNQFVVRESADKEAHDVDWIGGLLVAVGIFGVVYGITEAPSQGLRDLWVATGLIGGLLAIAGFVAWELKARSPLLDMNLFKNKGFSVSALSLTLTFLAMAGVFFSISQLQQLILGMTPLESSLSMLPLMVPMLILSPLMPTVVKRFGARLTMSAGLMLVAVAFLVMSTWTAEMTYWNLLGVMVMIMAGISAAMTPGTNILMASVPRERSGMGSAANDLTRELGAVLGVAVLGSILSSAYSQNIASTVGKLSGDLATALDTSLATALYALQSAGPRATYLIDAAKDAWMGALSQAALVAAAVILMAAIIAFFALPKHNAKQHDDVV